MMLRTRFGYLDIYDHVPGYPDEDVRPIFDSSEELKGIRFVNLFWLRRMKKAAGRPKDLEDLRQLSDQLDF